MDKNGFLKKLRLFLADKDQKIWNDDELAVLLDEALMQYCIDSGCFTGSFDFGQDSNGVYHYPDDFASFMIGWNAQGQEITPATAKELFVRSYCDSKCTGEAEYIYDDLDSHGCFSLYPDPSKSHKRKDVTVTSPYGEISDNDYGVFLTEDYGTTLTVDVFDFAGRIFYRKIGKYENIKDYMAVIYYAMSLAYSVDSDLANAEMSAYWKKMYKTRLSVFGRIKHNNTGKTVSGNFF